MNWRDRRRATRFCETSITLSNPCVPNGELHQRYLGVRDSGHLNNHRGQVSLCQRFVYADANAEADLTQLMYNDKMT